MSDLPKPLWIEDVDGDDLKLEATRDGGVWIRLSRDSVLLDEEAGIAAHDWLTAWRASCGPLPTPQSSSAPVVGTAVVEVQVDMSSAIAHLRRVIEALEGGDA